MAKNFSQQFELKNGLLDAINIVRNSDKCKWVYRGCGKAFAGAGSWSFDNDFAKNVVIFVADKSL